MCPRAGKKQTSFSSVRLRIGSAPWEPTFFITPTASSVCPTNSSSFCSIFTRVSSLIISSSGFIPLAPPVFPLAFVASRLSLELSTALRALVANIKLVFSVVLHPAKKRLCICASCSNRASPTFSSAKAHFSSAVARWSSPPPECVSLSNCEPARKARARA